MITLGKIEKLAQDPLANVSTNAIHALENKWVKSSQEEKASKHVLRIGWVRLGICQTQSLSFPGQTRGSEENTPVPVKAYLVLSLELTVQNKKENDWRRENRGPRDKKWLPYLLACWH